MDFKSTPPPPLDENLYVVNGYKDRADYLSSLAEEYGNDVYPLSDLLGESEDFDGLVTSLEDLI